MDANQGEYDVLRPESHAHANSDIDAGLDR